MIVIEMRPSISHNDVHYGITHRSITEHHLQGKGNRRYNLVAWDNTVRLNSDPEKRMIDGRTVGPGKYVSPDGRGTDDPVSVVLSEVIYVISNPPQPRPNMGETLPLGVKIELVYVDHGTDGFRQEYREITHERWQSPRTTLVER